MRLDRWLLLSLLACAAPVRGQTGLPPYRDETLPAHRRAVDLVSRLTLEDKVSQMVNAAPAIPRLGIPAYEWWNEALHGVARAGRATVFPQAIGLAATWDTPLMHAVATAISDEGRAKHHEAIRHDSHERYQGLDFWSPNINLFRDPRWGRGQETYGEDPFLTGSFAVQFIRGLQGDDPRHLKTIATVKHFAVHSGPESDRHAFDAVVDERDLRESYLPQFEMGIREGHATSLMCAYNRVDGSPACASDLLLREILRGDWGFRGYVVSDCGAIDDVYLRHRTQPGAAEAASAAVQAGTDLDCGHVYDNLVDAVHRGLIAEARIDSAVTRLFEARMRLGMFDDPAHVPWARIPYAVVDDSAHRVLARRAARESIVLLRNAGGVLPLSKDLGTIAVIGPNADEPRVLLGNYNGEPTDPITPLRGIREAVGPRTRVLHARGSDLVAGLPVAETVPASPLRTPDGAPGLRAEYFAGQSVAGTPRFVAVDSTLSVNWHEGSPRADLPVDSFSVRWTGRLRVPQTGSYRLGLTGTLRFRLWLDDSLLVRSVYPSRDAEFPDPRQVLSGPLMLTAGSEHALRVEAVETYGDAQMQLVWTTPSDSLEEAAVRIARQADAIVLVLGLTPRLEGEEMPVELPGFRGGDRTRIDLPDAQQHLLERITALGKPTTLVLLNGSALATTWAQSNVPAVVEAWYPGQAGGAALADVLFGDYDPAGRLPVTVYRDTADLPPFASYAMEGRTYRFFRGTPLYAFGHGLSYTRFGYARLRTSAETVTPTHPVTVQVDVTNRGGRAGDEVVQLYARHPSSRVRRPLRELRGFQRVTLQPGETRTVSFPIAARALAYWDPAAHRWALEREPVVLEVGASSADIRLSRTIALDPAAGWRGDALRHRPEQSP